MKTLKKLFLLSATCLMLPSVLANESVDNAIIDILFETVEGKEIVFYSENNPLYAALKEKAQELDCDTTFIDTQIITGKFSNSSSDDIYRIFKSIYDLDNPELYLIALSDPNSLTYQFISEYEETLTDDLAFFEGYDNLYVDDYIPTVNGLAFVPIKRSDLTNESLMQSVELFQEYLKKYEEATLPLKIDEEEELEPSEINETIRLHLSSLANILAWNATLLENYELAGRLYQISLIYYDNTSSMLSIASLIKENKISNVDIEAAENNLMIIAEMIKAQEFEWMCWTTFFCGYIYGPQYFLQNEWDWVIFGVPQNSNEFPNLLKKTASATQDLFAGSSTNASTIPSQSLLAKFKKYKLPETFDEYSNSNFFTFYSLIRNSYEFQYGKEYFITSVLDNPTLPPALAMRYYIELSLINGDVPDLLNFTNVFLENFGYNRQVAITRLLVLSRIFDTNGQIELLKTLIENDNDTCPWAQHIVDAYSAYNENDIITFNKKCADAINIYKGSDAVLLGYLYNIYTYSALLVGGIDSEQGKTIDLLAIANDKKKLKEIPEADFLQYAIGNYYLSQSEPEKAQIFLITAYTTNLFSPFYINDLVVALAEIGDYELGRALLNEHRAEITELEYHGLDTLAVCTLRANPNDAAKALKILKEAEKDFLESGKTEIPAEIYLHYAEIYHTLGEKEEAKKYLEKFSNMLPLDRPLLNSDQEVLDMLQKELK